MEPEQGTTSEPPDAPPARPSPPPAFWVIPRWVQMVLLPLALVALYLLASAAGTVLLVLIVASMIALILNPIVTFLHRHHVPRGLAIPISYLTIVAAFVAVGALLSSPVSSEVSRFSQTLPRYTHTANHDLAQLQRFFNKHGIHVHIQKQGQTALQTLEKSLRKHSGAIVSFSTNLLSKVVTVAIDAILVLVLSIYLLVYAPRIGDLVRRVMPPGDGTPQDDFPLLVQRALSGYVRGQLTFSLIMGVSAGVALTIYGLVGLFPAGKSYAVFFGGWYGLMELVPYIGPILGAIPPVLLALFIHPVSAIWVVLLCIVLQQLEGHVVTPQIFRRALRINPILIILALLFGYQLYGIAGSLIALPVAAVLRECVLYLRKHMVLEPWYVRAPGSGAGVGAGVRANGPGAERCPECDAPVAGEDDFCRACGAHLKAEVASGR